MFFRHWAPPLVQGREYSFTTSCKHGLRELKPPEVPRLDTWMAVYQQLWSELEMRESDGEVLWSALLQLRRTARV